jgi:hypothetical protein
MADRRRIKRKIVGGLPMLNAYERKAAEMAGYSCIYFVGHEGDDADDPIKVGYTHGLLTRMSHYRSAGWRAIKLHDVIYVRGPMSVVTMRHMNVLEGDDADIEKSVAAFHKALELDEDTVHIVTVEAAVHARFKELGLHHSREWFRGGPSLLIATARQTISEKFGVPHFNHSSMRRMVATWGKEAGLA